jgi:hypothetical protein
MGKLAPLANDAPPSVIFETLAVSSSTHYAARSSFGESGTVEVTVAVFLSTLTLFCKVSSVICDPAYFNELCLNNFLFVYAYSNCSNSSREGRLDFSILFYIVTNFRKSRDQPGHLCSTCAWSPHWRQVKMTRWPTDISTHLVGLCSYSYIKVYTAYSLMLTKNYKTVTYLPKYMLFDHLMC